MYRGENFIRRFFPANLGKDVRLEPDGAMKISTRP